MLKYLNTFVAVAKHQSFAQAGNNEGLSHTGVSMHIKRLEEHLKCQLFDRAGKKKIVLTPKGVQLLPLATQIVALCQQLKVAVGAAELGGKLRAGIISSVQNYLLPRAIRRFYDAYPAAEVYTIPGASVHLLAMVDSGEIDIAVIDKPAFPFSRSLVWTPILREPYVLAVPPNVKEKTVADILSTCGLIAYPGYSNSGKKIASFLTQHRMVAKKMMEQDDPFVILRLVEEGIAAAITPLHLTFAIADFTQKVRIIPLGKALYRDVGILQKKEAGANPLCATFVAAFSDEAKALSAGVRNLSSRV